ncbi:hypothetical protein JCM10450v2_002603 [Rhodotorula kratochvilovae]
MAPDLVRDSTFGQLVNYLSNGRLLPYADQRPDYVVPARYRKTTSGAPSPSSLSRTSTLAGEAASLPPFDPDALASKCTASCRQLNQTQESTRERPQRIPSPDSPADGVTLVDGAGVCRALKVGDSSSDLEKQEVRLQSLRSASEYPWLVTFDGPNDPDRPQNWSFAKKLFVGFLICFLTFAIYIGSAIYTSSIPGLMSEYDVTKVTATAGLTVFVAAYGIGPMILTPMQELPAWGRTPVYLAGLLLYVLFQIPPIAGDNITVVLLFRFLSGFFGSPALATGGASMADIFPPHLIATAIGAWSIGAVCGPVLGPVLSGFAVMNLDWRWSFIEQLILGGVALAVLFVFLPETLESTVLLRRAQRLRKLTGSELLKTQAELDGQASESVARLVTSNIVRAFRLSADPALFVAHFYITLVYCELYLWFEAFPLLYNEEHHFNLGVGQLPYLTFLIAAIIAAPVYVWYQLYHINPRFVKNPDLPPEIFLELGLLASPFIPISLFIFGWTAQANVHWIWPTIGAALYLPGLYFSFQSILTYVSLSYPKDAGAALAGNDFWRSVIASVFPLFGERFFHVLGLGGGSSFLAGFSILMVPFLYLIMKNGARLRARSAFAQA